MTMHYQKVSPPVPQTLPREAAPQTLTREALLSRGMRRISALRRPGLYRNGGKRLFDILAIVLAAPVILPPVLVLALIVGCTGGQPFYRQARVGRGGRIYTMWKLRSMETGAEEALADHLATDPTARAEWDATQKLRNDPRVTRLGRFLRKSSMDELPQLWNVLRGDMSLVGPRPMMPDQQDLYPGEAYYALRPGITGPWQVSERNQSTFADRAHFDTAYERDLSLPADLRLLAATVGVVLKGTGC